MFENLTDKLSGALKQLSGRGRITEENVREAMADVRRALLEADVNHDVVRDFTSRVLEKAKGQEVIGSLHPGEQMIKIVHDELIELMGPVDQQILYVQPGPTVIMMAGLNGTGKTTACAKLAVELEKAGKNVCLGAVDLQRPAAVEQLRTLAEQADAFAGGGRVWFYGEPEKCDEYGKATGVAVKVAKNAVKAARKGGADVLILDTAGRQHVDDDLMNEVSEINKAVTPQHIYLVVDAMTGQDAVHSAKAFNERLELDGVILTKMDSDTRGGAALSVKAVTGKPIKYIGTSEKLDGLEAFHPDRMASRILGMGDVVSLAEKAQEQVSQEEAEALQEKMASGKMTMDDFLEQMRKVRKMGSMKSLLGMLPGLGSQLQDMDLDDNELVRTEAMIQSMTRDERDDADIIDNSRRRRIARGSGAQPEDVSQLQRASETVSNMTQQMSGLSGTERMKALSGLGESELSQMGTRGGSNFKVRQRSKRKRKDRKRKSR